MCPSLLRLSSAAVLLPLFAGAARAEDASQVHVLLVNVSTYSKSKVLPQLRPTQKAAEDLVSLIAGKAPGRTSITRLTDDPVSPSEKQPTAANIRAALAELATRARGDDEVYVLVAGVGFQARVGGAIFCGSDAVDLSNPEALIPVEELVDYVKAIPCRRRCLAIDACRQFIDTSIKKQEVPLPPSDSMSMPLDLQKPGTFVLLEAASAHQLAYNDDSGLGLFFRAMINGLTGKADASNDGNVTMTELCAFVRRAVPAEARDLRQSVQHPQVSITGSEEEEWLICSCPIKASNPASPNPVVEPVVLASAPPLRITSVNNSNPVTTGVYSPYSTNPVVNATPRYQTNYQPRYSGAVMQDRPVLRAAARAGIAYGLSRIPR